MVNHPNRGKQRTIASAPTPAEIRKARKKNGHTQREAADVVFATERAWTEWEADRGPEGYPGRQMHPGLFLLYRARTAPTAREKAAVLNGVDGYIYGLGEPEKEVEKKA